ncbi:hypothetical protein LTR53_001289 [Teratosphaeriaceae sp. CCFEE 6253]|nr:hypothetical protein LTR53_001289 [Teratosphaeriaceae sp. CCFEE 6253]
MSVVTLDEGAPKLSADTIKSLASKAGLTINPDHVPDFQRLLGAMEQGIHDVLDADDYYPVPDLAKYPRTNTHIPTAEDSDKGGWATRVTAKSTSPTSDLLKGKTIALKDNVALAGVRCTNGTAAMDWTPDLDATIATRIMDAGGLITGKSTCENACLEGVSDTSVTGKVHNPYADGYSCGGSSSGSGRLVATGSVDMAIGCDQGGSIRIPASMCGIVGHKPTWGLVPYTGIISGECTIDHAGPMARTVRDTALLLQAIAGPDGIDDRQPPFLPDPMLEFIQPLDAFLAATTSDPKHLAGTTIGVLDEAFAIPNMDPAIASLCHAAIAKLSHLGATTTRISIPSHTKAVVIWAASLPLAGGRQGSLSDMTGRKQLYLTDRVVKNGRKLSQAAWEASGPGAQNQYLRYLYVEEKYGPELHAKASNLLRKINVLPPTNPPSPAQDEVSGADMDTKQDDYDRALKEVDALVMPTLPSPPCRLFADPAAHGPLERLTRNVGLVGNTAPFNSEYPVLGNTAPFNSTGHPALSIPVGFVPAHDDERVKLPAGLQLVGKKWRDIDCLKVGAAFERAYDWKMLGSPPTGD